MALREYLTTEVAEDWVDGLISRREALRRLVLLGLSLPTASALLAACAAEDQPKPSTAASTSSTAAPTGRISGSGGSPGISTPATSAAGPTALASAGPSGSAASSAPGTATTFAGPSGELQGFFVPASTPRGGMLVIHENRGLTDHIRSVASRLAGDGYSALAIDLLSEEGGTAAIADAGKVGSILGGASTERLVGDMRAGIDELMRRLAGARVGIIGFCFGGGMVWTLLDAGEPRLAAAIPFYGPVPAQPDFTGETAAVMGVYAELDSRVNATRDRAAAALDAAGLRHEMRVYPGVDHAFFNDTGGRYDATQAAAAYRDVLDWLGRYLGS